MNQHYSPRTIRRQQWFVALTNALTEAEKLLMLMEANGGYPVETERLRLRVEAVRAELGLIHKVRHTESRIVSNDWPVAEVGGH